MIETRPVPIGGDVILRWLVPGVSGWICGGWNMSILHAAGWVEAKKENEEVLK